MGRAHLGLCPDERPHGRGDAVRHELELAVGRDEADRPVVLEARQAHALVELDVLHLDGLPARVAARALEHYLVVQPEPKFGHARQVALHLDRAEDLRADDVAVRIHKQVDALDDVQEDFVLTVADTFGPPRDSIRDRNWWPDLDLELVRLLCDIS